MITFRQFVDILNESPAKKPVKFHFDVGDEVETELGKGHVSEIHHGTVRTRAYTKVKHYEFHKPEDQDWKDGRHTFRVMSLKHI